MKQEIERELLEVFALSDAHKKALRRES